MAEKLKSISKQIHWSLLVKGIIFALGWFFLPFWLFFLLALYLYFFPFFQSKTLAIPFFGLLLLSYIEPTSFLFGLILGGLFYYLLLIKDFFLIDRRSAQELFIFALSFFLLRSFYEGFGSAIGWEALWYSFLLALAIGILVGSFINSFASNPQKQSIHRVGAWLSFLLLWQAIVFGLLLPLDFIYQSVIIFLVVIPIVDLVPDHALGSVSREKLMTTGVSVFVLLGMVLLSARWGL